MTPGLARGSLLVAAAAVCWGAQPTLTRLLFAMRLGPVELSALRAPIALAILAAALALTAPRRLVVAPRNLPALGLFGVVGMAGVNFAYFLNLELNTVATAVLLMQTAPVVVAALSGLLFRERVPGRVWLAAGLALAGAFVMVGGLGRLRVTPAGLAAGLFCAALYSAYLLSGKRLLERHDSWTVLAYALASATLFWLVVAPGTWVAAAGLPGAAWAGVVALATVTTLVPYGLSMKGLALLSPPAVAVVMALEPVAGIAIAWLVLGEPVAGLEAAGGALVLAAVLVAQARA